MSKYSECPECGKKGVYRSSFVPAFGEIDRCRYCGWAARVVRGTDDKRASEIGASDPKESDAD